MHLWKPPGELMVDVDAVLRGQGADPKVIRQRSPRLVDTARRALKEGLQFIESAVLYKKLKVNNVKHELVILDNGKRLSGPLIANHISSAEYIVVLLCTVGKKIDEYIANVIANDLVYGLALDGVGSAAVEALANAACSFFENEAAELGFQSSTPISPGMIGWDVFTGQRELFEIVDASMINVELSPRYLMSPSKSLSMVLGFGPEMNLAGKTCDFCQMRENCQYKDLYEPAIKSGQ